MGTVAMPGAAEVRIRAKDRRRGCGGNSGRRLVYAPPPPDLTRVTVGAGPGPRLSLRSPWRAAPRVVSFSLVRRRYPCVERLPSSLHARGAVGSPLAAPPLFAFQPALRSR